MWLYSISIPPYPIWVNYWVSARTLSVITEQEYDAHLSHFYCDELRVFMVLGLDAETIMWSTHSASALFGNSYALWGCFAFQYSWVNVSWNSTGNAWDALHITTSLSQTCSFSLHPFHLLILVFKLYGQVSNSFSNNDNEISMGALVY